MSTSSVVVSRTEIDALLLGAQPTTPDAIRTRLRAIDQVMARMTGQQYLSGSYTALGKEWQRLTDLLGGGYTPGRGALSGATITRGHTPSPTDLAAAVTNMIADPPPRKASAICERLEIVTTVMADMTLQRGTTLYNLLAREADRLRDDLADVTGLLTAAGAASPGGRPAWKLSRGAAAGPDPTVRLDADTQPRVTIHLSRRALGVVTAECDRCDRVETGGWLVGKRPRDWHAERSVVDALVAATNRRADRVGLMPDMFEDADGLLRAACRAGKGADLAGIGDWHSHTAGGNTPSGLDLVAWARCLAEIGDHHQSFASLIVGRSERGSWLSPTITGWVTRHARTSFGERFVVEPAIVKAAQ